MKIAVISENGKTISQHFGMATQYVILKTEGERIVSVETRPKASHTGSKGIRHDEHGCNCEVHGNENSIFDRHRPMVLNILDCDVVLAGGIGWGAYDSLKNAGIEVVVTDVENIEKAVKLYLGGNLPNLVERLH